MHINLAALRTGQVSYADLMRNIRHADLCEMISELFDNIETILTQATDAAVLFVPHDAEASEQNEQGWALSHIIAHLTATLEESAAAGAMLARGVEVKERLRYETPWEQLSTLQMVQARSRESRRMCLALLDAWPDEPHLDLTVTRFPLLGPMDAVGLQALGIAHGQGHLDQIRETMRQFTMAENL